MATLPAWARQIYVSCPKPRFSQGEELWNKLEDFRKIFDNHYDGKVLMYKWNGTYDSSMVDNATCVFIVMDYDRRYGYYLGSGCYKELERARELNLPIVFVDTINDVYRFSHSVTNSEYKASRPVQRKVDLKPRPNSSYHSLATIIRLISHPQGYSQSESKTTLNTNKQNKNYYYLLV